MVACNISGVCLNRPYQRLGSRSRKGCWRGSQRVSWDAACALHLTNPWKLCSQINARTRFRLKGPQKETSFWSASRDHCQTSLVGCWGGWLLPSFLSLGKAVSKCYSCFQDWLGSRSPKELLFYGAEQRNLLMADEGIWVQSIPRCSSAGKMVQGVQSAGVKPIPQWWLAALCPVASSSCYAGKAPYFGSPLPRCEDLKNAVLSYCTFQLLLVDVSAPWSQLWNPHCPWKKWALNPLKLHYSR